MVEWKKFSLTAVTASLTLTCCLVSLCGAGGSQAAGEVSSAADGPRQDHSRGEGKTTDIFTPTSPPQSFSTTHSKHIQEQHKLNHGYTTTHSYHMEQDRGYTTAQLLHVQQNQGYSTTHSQHIQQHHQQRQILHMRSENSGPEYTNSKDSSSETSEESDSKSSIRERSEGSENGKDSFMIIKKSISNITDGSVDFGIYNGGFSSYHGSLSEDTENENNSTEGPQILTPEFTHVSTRVGQTTVFTCIVTHLGNRQVSWIRGRDLHVLSSGHVTFSSDSRLSVSRQEDSWQLTIRYTQPRDAGSYGCQVNTRQPLAVWFNLTVMEARARILGKESVYVQAGSTVTLRCVIREPLVIPGLVLWYHNDRLVERESGRVQVVTEVTNMTTSTLSLSPAVYHDSGNYSCWPSAGRPHTVHVHVIKGDPPAAMHHGSGVPSAPTPLLLLSSVLASPLMLLLQLFT